MAGGLVGGLNKSKSPLFYENESHRPRETKQVFLVLGYISYPDENEETYEDEKVWEIIETRRDLFDYFKTNYEYLNLDETVVYSSSMNLNEEYKIDMKISKTAIEMIRSLQQIFKDDNFDIDELI